MPPPVLLLHGFLGRGADWAPVAERLAGTRRVLAPDLVGEGGHGRWGMGDGESNGEPLTLDAEPVDVAEPRTGSLAWTAERLVGRLDAERLEAVDVAGYSMGGRLALVLALRHPDRVCRLVIVSASPGLRTADERAARRASDAALAREIVADFPGFLDRWTRQPLFASLSEAQRARLVADRLAHGRPEALARSLTAMGTGAMPSLWEPLRTLGVETVAVAGALDPKYVAIATSTERIAAGVRANVIPNAGHNLLAEAPDALADLLLHLFA